MRRTVTSQRGIFHRCPVACSSVVLTVFGGGGTAVMSRAAGATGQVASRSLKCPMPALQQSQRYLATSTSRPGIPTTMRAAVVEKFGAPLVIKNVPVPTDRKSVV